MKRILIPALVIMPLFAAQAAVNCESDAHFALLMIEDERPDVAAKLLAITDRITDELFSEDGSFIESQILESKAHYRLCMQTFHQNVDKEEVEARWAKIEAIKRDAIKNADDLFE